MKIYGIYGIHIVKLKRSNIIFIDDAHTRQPNSESILDFINTIYKPGDVLMLELPDKTKCLSYGEKTMSYLNDDMSFSLVYKYYPDAICVDYRGVLPTYYLTSEEIQSLGKLKKTGTLKLRWNCGCLSLYVYFVLQQLGRIEPLDLTDYYYKEDIFKQIINMTRLVHTLLDNRLINYYTMYSEILIWLTINSPIIFNNKRTKKINDMFNDAIIERIKFVYSNTLDLIKFININDLDYEEMAFSKDDTIVNLKNQIAMFRFSDPIMNYVAVNKILKLKYTNIIMLCGNAHTYEIINTLKNLNCLKHVYNTKVQYKTFDFEEPIVPIGQKFPDNTTHNASDTNIIPYIELF